MRGWQILCDGHVLFDPRGANDDDKMITRDEDIEIGVNMIGSACFTVGVDHPNLDKITRVRSVIELVQDNIIRYKGRLTHDIYQLSDGYRIETEGLLACLRDSVVEPYDFPADYESDSEYTSSENVVEFWLSRLLSAHNEQVGDNQKIYLGTVTVADPNNYITRSNQSYSTTWDTLKDKLFGSSLGGYLIARYENDGKTYIDYLSDLQNENVQQVRYAYNLRDIKDDVDSSGYYTAILPTGKDGLTIAELPDGELGEGIVKIGKVIHNASMESQTGVIITKIIPYEGITIAANLQTAAIKDVSAGVTLPHTIECMAADLNGADGDIPPLEIGKYTRVTDDRGNTALFPLVHIRPNIHNPGQTEITMGRTTRTLTRAIMQSQNVTALVGDISKRLDNLAHNTVPTSELTAITDSIPVLITRQPQSRTAHSSDTVTASVTAVGTDLHYQWYMRGVGDTEYTKTGDDSSTISITVVESKQVYCVVSDDRAGYKVATRTATITLEA